MRSVHLGLRALVFEDDLQVARDLDDGAARVGLGLGEGKEHVAVREYTTIAGLRGIFPRDLAVGVEDLRGAPEHQEGPLGRRLGRGGEEQGGEESEDATHRGSLLVAAPSLDSHFRKAPRTPGLSAGRAGV